MLVGCVMCSSSSRLARFARSPVLRVVTACNYQLHLVNLLLQLFVAFCELQSICVVSWGSAVVLKVFEVWKLLWLWRGEGPLSAALGFLAPHLNHFLERVNRQRDIFLHLKSVHRDNDNFSLELERLVLRRGSERIQVDGRVEDVRNLGSIVDLRFFEKLLVQLDPLGVGVKIGVARVIVVVVIRPDVPVVLAFINGWPVVIEGFEEDAFREERVHEGEVREGGRGVLQVVKKSTVHIFLFILVMAIASLGDELVRKVAIVENRNRGAKDFEEVARGGENINNDCDWW